MAADMLSERGVHVDVFEAMPSVGRKFLMAGKSGLNVSKVEPIDNFVVRYPSAWAWY
jgi:predicted flavoprotein YhiN